MITERDIFHAATHIYATWNGNRIGESATDAVVRARQIAAEVQRTEPEQEMRSLNAESVAAHAMKRADAAEGSERRLREWMLDRARGFGDGEPTLGERELRAILESVK